jgi:hypothetical protein
MSGKTKVSDCTSCAVLIHHINHVGAKTLDYCADDKLGECCIEPLVLILILLYFREERNFNQSLRQQQDEAYLESLKADQEKVSQNGRYIFIPPLLESPFIHPSIRLFVRPSIRLSVRSHFRNRYLSFYWKK